MDDAPAKVKTPLPEPYGSTVELIFRQYEEREESERGYLGPSTLGTDCDRALWYGFRWASPPEKFSGRMLRLFETGHREEARMVADLRMAGIHVQEYDPDTGKQWEVESCGGHVRGHMDGKVHGLPEAPATPHILECKTHNEKSFKELVAKGVKAAKPGHYRQMMAYMHFSGASRALYLAHNKNTDELHAERVPYDPKDGVQITLRMEKIVRAEQPPAKLHENPNAKMAFECGYCRHAGACHRGEWARRNCRTCLHSTPNIETGAWDCSLLQCELSHELQQQGCMSHLFIPGLVPGEQIDADAEANTVTYRLASGGVWTDGVA